MCQDIGFSGASTKSKGLILPNHLSKCIDMACLIVVKRVDKRIRRSLTPLNKCFTDARDRKGLLKSQIKTEIYR